MNTLYYAVFSWWGSLHQSFTAVNVILEGEGGSWMEPIFSSKSFDKRATGCSLNVVFFPKILKYSEL